MAVDVIIVNWNGGAELVASVASVHRFGARPIVVDNASSGGSIDVVAGMPGVTLLFNPTNRGFAAATNRGVAAGDAEVVMLLNPDAEIVSGTADDLELAIAGSVATIFGVTLEGTSGRRLSSLYGFPRMRDLLSDVLRFRALGKLVGRSHSPAPVVGELGEPSQSVWIVGAGLAMRRSDWLRAGGLDEGYFLWYEDIDLGARVTRAGGTCTILRDIVVRHHGAMSWVRLTRRRRQVLRLKSARRYASQHMSSGTAALILACGPLAYVIGVGLDVIHWPLDPLLRRTLGPRSAGSADVGRT